MKRLLVVVAFALLIAPVVASANQEIGRELVEFKIIFTVPEPGVHGTQVECQYSNSRNLWIRSSAGNEELLSIRSGESVVDECRFSGSVTLDVHAEQTFTFDYRELFTMTPDEMIGNNVVEIEFDPVLGYQGHELQGPLEGGQIADTDKYRIMGTFELSGKPRHEFMRSPVGCIGMGGYKDIKVGTQLTISDQSGDIIAVTRLDPDPMSEGADDCLFEFVAEVPEALFYTISMGRRGEITYSFDELEKVDWLVEMTLGK